MNVAVPSLVTRVRSGTEPPFSVQVPTGGSQSLMAQNGPINDQTAATEPLTSALRDSVTAEAGATLRLTRANAPSAAIATLRFMTCFFIWYPFGFELLLGAPRADGAKWSV